MRLPRIPRTVHSAAGPVPVERVDNLRDPEYPSRSLYGLWVPDSRLIKIERGVGLETAWQTLFHEQFHAWIDDNGVELGKTTLERLCEMYGSGRMGEWWEHLRKNR